ncbi:hypothetical protein Tco_0138863 [Tanacetum coccineum]
MPPTYDDQPPQAPSDMPQPIDPSITPPPIDPSIVPPPIQTQPPSAKVPRIPIPRTRRPFVPHWRYPLPPRRLHPPGTSGDSSDELGL